MVTWLGDFFDTFHVIVHGDMPWWCLAGRIEALRPIRLLPVGDSGSCWSLLHQVSRVHAE
ncbi:MAG: hypothetical protein V2B20_19940 [Pseudomonadota bacterium]